MGLYAEAVQSKGYRNAKIRTLLGTASAVLGPSGSELDLQRSPDGAIHASATIVVSNNPLPARSFRRIREQTPHRRRQARRGPVPARGGSDGHHSGYQVEATRPVPLGFDGEAIALDPPIRSGYVRARCAYGSPPTPRCVTLGDAARSLR